MNQLLQNSNNMLQKIGIHKTGAQRITYKEACYLLVQIIKEPKLSPFLGLDKNEETVLKEKIDAFQQERWSSMQDASITQADRHLHSKALHNLMQCQQNTILFTVEDAKNTDLLHLCLCDGELLTLHKKNNKFYVSHQLPELKKEQIPQISDRLALLSHSGFFPEMEMVLEGGKNVIASTFIPGERAEKYTDITNFHEFCKQHNFGADTNMTNFYCREGSLVYVDRDAIEWAVEPEKHPFNEKITKPFIWQSQSDTIPVTTLVNSRISTATGRC